MARQSPASPTAKAVTVAQDAKVLANATGQGNGGRVTVLSTDQTTMAGRISATGAGQGNGGFVEVSGDKGYALTGSIDTGATGTILLDPQTLDIVSTLSNTGATFTPDGAGGGSVADTNTGANDILASTFTGLTGNVILSAGTLLNVQTGITSSTLASLLLTSPTITFGGNSVSLTGAGATLSVQANTITASTGATLNAATIELAPFTVSTVATPITMSYGGTTATLNIPTTLTLTPTGTLRLGKAAGRISAGAVDIASALALGNANTLDLQSLGTIGRPAPSPQAPSPAAPAAP